MLDVKGNRLPFADHRWPRISVVTPSFNQGHYLEETISSVLDQGYPNLEYIVMDGGSTDTSKAIIERYAEQIDYWVSEKDNGQSDALNRGFARATGDILGWINSDDCLAPGALHAIAAAFMKGSADIVAGVVNVGLDGKLVYHHRTGLSEGKMRLAEIVDLENEWLQGRFFYQPEVYFSRKIYEAAGNLIDTSLHYSMDYDLWVRMVRAGARILPIDAEIANFRIHNEQKTSTTAAYLPELTRHANCFRAQIGLADIAPPDPSLVGAKRNLRVGMVNDYGFNYGAGRAHRRIADALAAHQIDVSVFAFRDSLDDLRSVTMDEAIDALQFADVDVIIVGNLHGVFPKGVSLAALAALAPLLLVTHDFFWFTGRCAYPVACDAYLFTCPPTCPTRDTYPVIPYDEIPTAHEGKVDGLSIDRLHFLANSEYMETITRRYLAVKTPDLDPAARVHRLQLAVTEACYQPGDQEAARAAMGLPTEAFIVLCSSSSVDDQRKGFKHVLEACRLTGQPIFIMAMGAVDRQQEVSHVHYTGYLTEDDAIARCYQAADVFISGSSSETFGQTFIEAAMCGCPSVGYASGGIVEAIVPDVTGWLVAPNDIAGLSYCLSRLVAHSAEQRAAFRSIVRREAVSRYGTPSLLAGLDSIFRQLVTDPAVAISKSVQFGGIRTQPIRTLSSRRVSLAIGFAAPEGPFPDLGVEAAISWQTSPVAEIGLYTMKGGPHLVTLCATSLVDEQSLGFSFDGEIVGRHMIGHEPWSVQTEISLALDLAPGENTVVLETSQFFPEPNSSRPLYCAFRVTGFTATETADGLRPLRRVPPASSTVEPSTIEPEPSAAASESPPPVPSFMQGRRSRLLQAFAKRLKRADGPTFPIATPHSPPDVMVAPVGRLLQPHLRLLTGFAMVEGPYPTMGVAWSLAWQTSASATLSLTRDNPAASAAALIAIDVVLPCEQTLTVRIDGRTERFEAIARSPWERPTRLLLHAVHLVAGPTLIRIDADHNIVDSANRDLYAALLGVTVACSQPDIALLSETGGSAPSLFEMALPTMVERL